MLTLLPLEPRDTPAVINPLTAERFAVGGSGLGGSAQLVRMQTDGSLLVELSVVPFPGFAGEVRVASADITGDGVIDLICAAGPGGGPHVKVFDGAGGREVRSFFAFDAGFLGGLSVAAADVTGDGIADVIVGAGAGGGPHVKVFDAGTQEVRSFFAFDPNFRGGVSVGGGDRNSDGFADLTVAAGPGAGPHVKTFDGRTGAELQSFFAFDPTSTTGVNVAVGDLNGDGRADLVLTQAGPPVGPAVSGPTALVAYTQNLALPLSFTRTVDPFGAAFNGGIRVGTADADGDGKDDALFATGNLLRAVFARDLLVGNGLAGSVQANALNGVLSVG